MAEETKVAEVVAEPAAAPAAAATPAKPAKAAKKAKAPAAKKAAAPKKEKAPAAPKAPKSPKPKKTATKTAGAHPHYLEMVVAAVKALKERSGSSRQAILKYILANYAVGSDPKAANLHLKQALKRGVTSGALKNTKVNNSFISCFVF